MTTTSTKTGKEKRRGMTFRQKDALVGYLMISPIMLGILFFAIVPIIFSLFISFTSWNMITPWEWVGLANYRTMFNDRMLGIIWSNTLTYVLIGIPGSIIVGLLLALGVSTAGLRGGPFYRTVFFLPNITTTVAIVIVWSWLYDRHFGLFNNILAIVGIAPVPWLSSTAWAMPSIAFMAIWQAMGYNMIILAAGLKGIDETYYEAAKIDGASKLKCLRYITLPMLTPTLFFLVVMQFIGFFQMFDAAFVMTQGGPGHATNTIVLHIYRTAFTFFRMGEASAYAWLMFAVVFVVTGIQFALQKKWVTYDA